YYLTERKHSCAPQNILQATVPVSSSELLSNLDLQFQVVKDPNARKSGIEITKKVKELGDKDHGQPKNLAKTKALYDELLQLNPNAYFQLATEEEKHKEQGFFDESEIEKANLQLTKSEEIVIQQTTLLDNIELQSVQELPIYKEGFLDLDVEQNRIQTAKNMFKVAKYAFLTWFTKAKKIDLASIILEAENKNEAMQEVYLQCLYQNYSEKEEINEIIKLAIDAYRALDKENDFVYGDKSQTKIAFKIIDKYEPIYESKKADKKYVREGPNVILTKKMKPGFWVGIDEKFLVRKVSKQSEVGRLESNAKKHTEIIEACKQLVNDTIDWQYQKKIINKKKKLILSKSLKVVNLAEQFMQGGKIDEKHLTYKLVIDRDELNFLIKDCTDVRTFAGREEYPLGFILTYYKRHQSQYTHLQASMLVYAHINLLEMLWRFDFNEVVRIATDSKYVQKEALYKIKNILAFFNQVEVKLDPNLCLHYPSCAMCNNLEEFLISKSEYAKWIKEFLSKAVNQQEEQEPKNKHWKLIKDISNSRFHQFMILLQDIKNYILIKEEDLIKQHKVREWTSECIREKKFPRVVIWDEVICCNNNVHLPQFFGKMPYNWLKEYVNYYKEVLTNYRAKCPKLCKLKKAICQQNNRIQSKLFRELLSTIEKYEFSYVEYLNQLIWVEAPSLPPKIAQEIEMAKKKRQLKHKLRPSI
ncbi:13328_t:CDS:10, partial [Cetraspora pellucida]